VIIGGSAAHHALQTSTHKIHTLEEGTVVLDENEFEAEGKGDYVYYLCGSYTWDQWNNGQGVGLITRWALYPVRTQTLSLLFISTQYRGINGLSKVAQWNDLCLSLLRSRVRIPVGPVPHVMERAPLFDSIGFLRGSGFLLHYKLPDIA
jgi:hypothetical protein